MDLVKKLTLLKDNGAETIDCSAAFSGNAGRLEFRLDRSEFCHALAAVAEWQESRQREPVSKRAEQEYVSARKHFRAFDAIVNRMFRKIGQERIAFELYDYGNKLGVRVAAKERYGNKIAFVFETRDGADVVDAVIAFVLKWDDGLTEYKGIEPDHITSGQECTARSVLDGETK
jgi:hypothetical protein